MGGALEAGEARLSPPAESEAAYARRITFFTLLGHALTHLYLTLFPPLLQSMAGDFSLDVAGATFYYTIANVCFGLGAVPSGWLASRLGDKPLLVAFFVGSAVGGALIGAAGSRWVLGAGAVCLGLATSIYHPVGVALLSKGARLRGLAMGLNGVAGSVGTAAGPFYAFAVLRAGLSWREAFLLLALPTLLLGGWFCAARLGPAAAPARRGPGGRPALPPDGERRTLGRSRIALFSFLLAAMTLVGFNFQLAITRLPPLLSRTGLFRDLPQAQAEALLAGFPLLFGGLGQLAAGFLADRFDERKLYVAALALGAPLTLLLGEASSWPLLAISALAFTLIFAAQPIENSVLARYSPPRWRAMIYGLKFILVFGVGGTGSLAAGVIEKSQGLSRIYQAGAATLALACVFAVLALLTPLADESPGEIRP